MQPPNALEYYCSFMRRHILSALTPLRSHSLRYRISRNPTTLSSPLRSYLLPSPFFFFRVCVGVSVWKKPSPASLILFVFSFLSPRFCFFHSSHCAPFRGFLLPLFQAKSSRALINDRGIIAVVKRKSEAVKSSYCSYVCILKRYFFIVIFF